LADDVLAEARRWGDEWGASMMLTLGASLRLWTGRFTESVQYSERALAGFRKIGDRFGALQSMAPLHRARAALGRTADAERGMEELLALSDAFGEMAFPAIAASGVAMHLGRGQRTVELASEAVERMAATGSNVDEARVQLSIGQLQSGRADDALATLVDVAVDGSPFALAARALAHTAVGDLEAAVHDADAALAITGLSYFDRCLALLAAAAASHRAGCEDAPERLRWASSVTAASGDVALGAVGRALAARLEGAGAHGDDEPALSPGWACVVDQLAGNDL
jgi:hypothetical protein